MKLEESVILLSHFFNALSEYYFVKGCNVLKYLLDLKKIILSWKSEKSTAMTQKYILRNESQQYINFLFFSPRLIFFCHSLV
jgi:hypothetical protein